MYVKSEYFFTHPHFFPWSFMNMSCPMSGLPHAYLCKFLAHFDMNQANFLLGNPTITELRRFGSQNDGLSIKIYQYCDMLYSHDKSDRDSVAIEVLGFMERYEPFVKHFQAKMDEAFRLKVIKFHPDSLYWKAYEGK